MIISTPKGTNYPGQLSRSHTDQLEDYEKRRELTSRYSTAISVANHQRNEFMQELSELITKYENAY